jgi:RNA polymerase sigma-70 factor (ECF subfamily)
MQAVQTGDGLAYAELLRELAPLLRRMIRRRQPFALPHQDVEDLVQDVLLSLHIARATYDPDRPFLPWLAAIVRNRMADAARRAVRQRRGEADVEKMAETFLPAETNSIEDGYGDVEALRYAVADLPGGQRRAVELLKLRELSLKEASVVSGMSIGSLKVSVHRGIKSLRVRLMREV